jgi:hypothetical protein
VWVALRRSRIARPFAQRSNVLVNERVGSKVEAAEVREPAIADERVDFVGSHVRLVGHERHGSQTRPRRVHASNTMRRSIAALSNK